MRAVRPGLVALWADAWGREIADRWWRITTPLRGPDGADWFDAAFTARAPATPRDVLATTIDAWFREGMAADRLFGLGLVAMGFAEWAHRAERPAGTRFLLAIHSRGHLLPLADHPPSAAAYQHVHRQLIAQSPHPAHPRAASRELPGGTGRSFPFLPSLR